MPQLDDATSVISRHFIHHAGDFSTLLSDILNASLLNSIFLSLTSHFLISHFYHPISLPSISQRLPFYVKIKPQKGFKNAGREDKAAKMPQAAGAEWAVTRAKGTVTHESWCPSKPPPHAFKA